MDASQIYHTITKSLTLYVSYKYIERSILQPRNFSFVAFFHKNNTRVQSLLHCSLVGGNQIFD